MTDKDLGRPNEPLRQWCARTLRVALARDGVSRRKLHQQGAVANHGLPAGVGRDVAQY